MPRSLDRPGAKSMHSVRLVIIMVYGMPIVAWKKSFNNASPQVWAWRGFLSLAVLIRISIQYCSRRHAPSAVRGVECVVECHSSFILSWWSMLHACPVPPRRGTGDSILEVSPSAALDPSGTLNTTLLVLLQ